MLSVSSRGSIASVDSVGTIGQVGHDPHTDVDVTDPEPPGGARRSPGLSTALVLSAGLLVLDRATNALWGA
jgi:hypothetical protein